MGACGRRTLWLCPRVPAHLVGGLVLALWVGLAACGDSGVKGGDGGVDAADADGGSDGDGGLPALSLALGEIHTLAGDASGVLEGTRCG